MLDTCQIEISTFLLLFHTFAQESKKAEYRISIIKQNKK